MTIRFSVVTPSYQAVGMLPRCIGSVRSQGAEVPVEHIVMDGGSKDGTYELLARLSSGQNSALQSYRLAWTSEPDRGMYHAINRGWSKATGDVLSWLNADEQYLPGTLASIAQVFAADPEIDIVFGDTIVVDQAGMALAARREIPLRSVYLRNGFLYAMSCATFFRRRLLDEGLLTIDESFRYAGDFDLMLRLLTRGATIQHLRQYVSLFGFDGSNLSVVAMEPAADEAEQVRQRYGALPRPLRQIVMVGRHVERLIRGCYRPEQLEYAFALDETPTFLSIGPVRVGGRFTFS